MNTLHPHLVMGGLALTLVGCMSHEPGPVHALTFEKDLKPLFLRHCLECHGVEAKEAGLDMSTVAHMLTGGESGPALVQGAPEESILLHLIEDGHMPPDGEPLSRDETALVRRWIAEGAN